MKKLIILLSLFFILFANLSTSFANTGNQCTEFFHILTRNASQTQRIGDSIEPRYTPTGRTKELPEIPVTNQCKTSECYLFSFVNFLNLKNRMNQANTDTPFRVSHPLLVAQKFLMHIREGVWYGNDTQEMVHNLRGGFSFEAMSLARLKGLAPDESWQPKVPFEQWDTKRIYSVLEAKVPEWHNYLQSLANYHGTWDHPKVREAFNNANESLKNVILDYSGPLPQDFDFRGRAMTPAEFEKLYGTPRTLTMFIDNKADYGKLTGTERRVLSEASPAWTYGQKDLSTILQKTADWIAADQPVIINFKWKDSGHSMLVVGYELNSKNQVVRFKIMNSWGPNFGNDGYVWYTHEDIANNLTSTIKFGVRK